MNRSHGLEKEAGIGGGTVSEESRAALEKAESYAGSKKRKPEKAKKAIPHLVKALKDPNNLDALIQMAFFHSLSEAVGVLEYAEAVGRAALERSLGSDCFSDDGSHVGNFWAILETRPYMRVLQAQVRVYFENKQFSQCAETVTEMLRLCPGDNMSQRTWAGSVLLHASRPSDALSFVQTWLDPRADRGSIPPRGGTAFEPPSPRPLSVERYEQLKDWCLGALPYTAALAAFKLWGNCALACQYLRIGAAVNPIILTKILGRSSKPSSLNMSPRSMNGAEDAQDYLWLSQDLWNAPDVWNWANSDQAKNSILKKCSRSDCQTVETTILEFKHCSQCKDAFYCGPSCQKTDWPQHKSDCKFKKLQKAAVKAHMEGKPPPAGGPIIATSDFSDGKFSLNGKIVEM